MVKVFAVLLIVFAAAFQISAQCGVHFKESSRQVFSNSFTNAYFDDFDNDALQDLFGYSVNQVVSSTPVSFQVHYYKRLGENSFDTTAKSTLITNVGAFFGVTGDVNGDGKKDLIIPHRTNPPTLRTYLNDGTGRFLTATPAVNINAGEIALAAGDLNNDGKADIVTNSGSAINYRLAQPDNSFGAPVAIGMINTFIQPASYMDWFSSSVIVEDFNNDGAKDIAIAQENLQILTNNGNLTFTQTHSGIFFPPTVKLRTFDLNNDGKKDFVTNPRGCCGQVRIAVNNGDNTFTTSTHNLPFSQTYDSPITKEFLVADLDNDGDTDLLYPAGNSYIVLRNQGNATFVREEFKSFQNIAAAANLDGDGKADSLALIMPLIDGAYRLNDGNNNFYYRLNNAVSFRKNVCESRGQTKIVDFDGDGFTDRAFWNTSTGIWRYYIHRILGSTVQNTLKWGITGDLPVPNDYDGDGKTDHAVFRRSTGTWWIYRSSDEQSYALNFGIAEDKPVPSDYDGDGRADIAVFRPSTGVWHFWSSRTSLYSVVHFGASEDKPVPADYDGDGRADISVFRPSTGVWYRFNSSDNSVFAVQYGIATDKPMPGDYDGDGKANIAVYRDGTWYVLKADFSTYVFNFGIANDAPFFDESPAIPGLGAFRRTTSIFWTTSPPIGTFATAWAANNTANDVSVSSILPPE